MILRPVRPQSPHRAADHEVAGRVDEVFRVPRKPVGGQHRFDDFFHNRLGEPLAADIGRVLGGQHHGFDGHWPALLVVAEAELALGVGAQEVQGVAAFFPPVA